MTETEAKAIIYAVFYGAEGRRSDANPSLDEFFQTKIEDTLGSGELEGWPTFILEALAVDIQREFQKRNYFIQNFGHMWLANNKSKPWQALIDHMAAGFLVETMPAEGV